MGGGGGGEHHGTPLLEMGMGLVISVYYCSVSPKSRKKGGRGKIKFSKHSNEHIRKPS